MKPIQIKIWPELTQFFPAIVPLQPSSIDRGNEIVLDFSNTTAVTASGLNLLLLRIIKLIEKSKSRKWIIIPSEKTMVNECIQKLGFAEILLQYYPIQKVENLFGSSEILDRSKDVVINTTVTGNIIKSFPLYEINYRGYDLRREAIQPLKDWLFHVLELPFVQQKFPRHHFISILVELAKNSADHTSENAFVGIDFIHDVDNNLINICFSFVDLGKGINQSVKEYLKVGSSSQRTKHLSLSEAYRYALSPGKTTKPTSMMNKGIGMSIIFDMSKSIGMELSVFDADSRGVLDKIRDRASHKELRRILYNVGINVGFSYYGDLKVNYSK